MSRELLDIFQLAEKKNRSVREMRTLVEKGIIPYLKLGHRTVRFDEAKVDQALDAFEVKAISAKGGKRK
jgi:hypothetical protein